MLASSQCGDDQRFVVFIGGENEDEIDLGMIDDFAGLSCRERDVELGRALLCSLSRSASSFRRLTYLCRNVTNSRRDIQVA